MVQLWLRRVRVCMCVLVGVRVREVAREEERESERELISRWLKQLFCQHCVRCEVKNEWARMKKTQIDNIEHKFTLKSPTIEAINFTIW